MHDTVLNTKSTMGVVEKGKEWLEMTRDANTKIRGHLKVGVKVAMQFESRATEIEVKA